MVCCSHHSTGLRPRRLHSDESIEDLSGQFAVWAASSEADFLHGRFVWANWDVDELRSGEIGERIREDEHFLKMGVEGLTEKTGGIIL